jgi:hypothetical protein
MSGPVGTLESVSSLDVLHEALTAALHHVPDDDTRSSALSQVVDFLSQTDFLRKALHVQLHMTGEDALSSEAGVRSEAARHREDKSLGKEAEAELALVFSMATHIGPGIEREVADALGCDPDAVETWFRDRRRAIQQHVQRLGNKARPSSATKRLAGAFGARKMMRDIQNDHEPSASSGALGATARGLCVGAPSRCAAPDMLRGPRYAAGVHDDR